MQTDAGLSDTLHSLTATSGGAFDDFRVHAYGIIRGDPHGGNVRAADDLTLFDFTTMAVMAGVPTMFPSQPLGGMSVDSA